ncbi:MAG: PfaB family protein [Elainellaceae cyanobacterium]
MDKVAVIGMACLLPGAQTPEAFWQNLVHGIDATSLMTMEDLGGLDPTVFCDRPKPTIDKTYSLKGGFIRDFTFDPHGYRLPPQFLTGLDPLFQTSLQVAKQALQDSGYLQNAAILAQCGAVLGNLAFPTRYANQLFAPLYQRILEAALGELLEGNPLQLAPIPAASQEQRPKSGSSKCTSLAGLSPENAMTFGKPATILAQALGLSSPHFCLDAACASSLYAVELACQFLQSHRADLMLAGAVSYADPLFNRMLFSGVQAYPDNGISRPLDAASRGLTPADGVVMLVLKRLPEAVRDGDRIYAVIRGVGLSNDGRDKHLLSPSQRGQVLAFERAYQRANLPPEAIGYLECHATGTLLGDTTELSSIEQFFGDRPNLPLLGSVKANVGHALTAAGLVGVMKAILSMHHGMISPIPQLGQPLHSPKKFVTGDRIVSTVAPWPNQAVRRAAVSAFGFGGTNAHLIVESPEAVQPALTEAIAAPKPALAPMAIVGMDTVFGPCDGLDAFERSIYEGRQHFIPLPESRWRGLDQDAQLLESFGLSNGTTPPGAYIKDFEVDPIRFRIPPNEVATLNPQQLLMLKVADRALRDAGLSEGGNVAVIVVMETDPTVHQLQQRWHLPWQIEQGLAAAHLDMAAGLRDKLEAIAKDSLHPPAHTSEFLGYVGNIVASRIAALWDFNGPALALGAGETSVAQALEVARLLLSVGDVDAVMVGAVDLAGSFEQVSLQNRVRPINTGRPTLSLDQQANGWLIGEGAGAVVLKRVEAAQQGGDRIYAILEAVGMHPPVDPMSGEGAIASTCRQAFTQSDIQATDISYLEVFGLGYAEQDSHEVVDLLAAYRSPDKPLYCALGSVEATIGHTGVASGMASLIKTALCLHHRYLPAVPQWHQPKQSPSWQDGPFHVAVQSLPWFLDPSINRRRAAIHGKDADGTHTHLVLAEAPEPSPEPCAHRRNYLSTMPLTLLAIAASDQAELLEQLNALAHQVEDGTSLQSLAMQTFTVFQQRSHYPYALVLLAQNKDELRREIQRAQTGVPQAFAEQGDWKTPSGSYFTAKPLGRKGQVAFVYSGAFGAYVGIGRQSFRLFPELYENPIMATLETGMKEIETFIYPRSFTKPKARQAEDLERKLLADPIAMLQVEVGCAGLTTAVLQDYFQLRPHCAFGYSLGETSMVASQGIWQNFDQLIQTFRQSSLFGDRLSGAKNALREYWRLAPGSYPADANIWSAHVLLASAADVKQAIAREERVYLTQINTPDEVVIAGEPLACQRIIDALGCSAFRAPFSHLIHCPPMASEFSELAALHTLPVQQQPDMTFYSAADYQPIALNSQSIGHAIAKNLCQQFDFPRLVNQVYQDGARIFVEVGAGNTCSRWIAHNLQGKDHLVEAFDKRGMETHGGLLRMLAKLVSHRVALDLSALYQQTSALSLHSRSITKLVTLGGPSISANILSDYNRSLFKGAIAQDMIASNASSSFARLPLKSIPQPQVIPGGSHHYQRMNEHHLQTIETSTNLFKSRQASLQSIGDLIQFQINVSKKLLDPDFSGDDIE